MANIAQCLIGDSERITVADPGAVRSPLLNILWKWNNLVSLSPNYFIFVGYLR